jgi:hypothetical protein
MAITKSGKKGNWDFNYPSVYSIIAVAGARNCECKGKHYAYRQKN